MTPKKPKTELELFQSHLDQILDREIPFTSFPARSNGRYSSTRLARSTAPAKAGLDRRSV